jgi:type IV pilus assembly protein PilA
MLQATRRRLEGHREGGFTRAQDRAAQASLRNALVAAKSIYTDKRDYGQAVRTSSANPLSGVERTTSAPASYASGTTCTATAAASATFTSKWG